MARHPSIYNNRDANEPELVRELGKVGVIWVEAGPLDGWINIVGRWMPVEIKTATGRLRPGQKEFTAMCKANDWPVLVWRTAEEAVNFVNIYRGTFR